MGKMAELWEEQRLEADQEDPKLYDEWKKESLKLLSPRKSIAQKIRDYFKKMGVK